MNYLSWLTASTAVLLTAVPSWAASQQITGVDLETTKQGLELQLKIRKNSQIVPSFISIDRGETLEATILNTELNLASNKSFSQDNPVTGVEKITLTQVDREHTKITVKKDASLALEPLIKLQGSKLVVDFDRETTSNSLLNKLPFSDNITSFRNNITSLVTNKKVKDNEKGKDREPAKSRVYNAEPENKDVLVPNPEIIISDGHNGVKPENSYEDRPYLPRAVAPPVGDMAVSNVGTFPDTVDLGSSAVVPRLVLRDAPVREVLSLLARQAGLNIVFATNEENNNSRRGEDENVEGPTVSLDLENQSVQEVFDSILLISSLNASRRGNIIYVGEKLPAQARNLISRSIRLNQVRAENAALFLASQGAQGQRLTTEVEETVDPETGRVVQRRELPASLEDLGGAVDEEEDSSSAFLLRGLQIATDDRLNSITLVGEPRKVEMATAFLTQLDARRRQVAVNVKVIDVNLLNQDVFNSSFSFGVNDSFFVQDNGAATLRFGENSPATGADLNSSTSRVSDTPVIANPFAGAETFIDLDSNFVIPGTGAGIFDGRTGTTTGRTGRTFFNRDAAISNDPTQAGLRDFTLAEDGTVTLNDDGTLTFAPGTDGTATSALPSFFKYPKKFLALLEARITSGNAKILTDPTIVVQEGQESTVKLTQDIIKGIDSNISDNGVTSNTPIYDEAGLTVTVNVERVDDNGFIALSVSPTVSSIASQQEFDSGNAINLISLLSRREVSSGLIRLRDGQTLILSGIIQDQERVAVTKVPILGDIPLLGSLFRSTNKTNERAEVIVLLTPEIIDEQADFGYNYQPGKDARETLKKGGMSLPNNPE